ncbi:polar amino acid transport system permease protein [Propionibacterium cyclohexanicum]|uniref:Polar amino acid transport system permease protein n=1 Tax=Propionibacterium cyclohexanicum TaxID=64702 RepID=A0A1H9RND3_9ACTN|nr:amino acid ABC transporter permease [Propionibacterium cyclohexanicum]SER74038.1 polar amino acid transport system permease protein [Propionibacterium cyclohexanicum]
MKDDQKHTEERPGRIDAVPVRHPWRWVAVVVVGILLAMLVHSFVTNPRWDWASTFSYMFKPAMVQGLIQGTLLGTVLAMIIGVVLGVLLAVMRLSSNPVLKYTAAVYTWFFRAIPRYVLLTILGVGLIFLYPSIDVGVPFGQSIERILGLQTQLTWWHIDMRTISSGIGIGAIGLGLSEAAYMAEIARAGIVSVDRGQTEAAMALGMSSRKTTQRIVLPQAMRVIVPPTGNEAIAMIKDTSLLTAIPVGMELFNQATIIANRTYKVMSAYVAATIWYLLVCSILMVAQAFLERRFGRGFGRQDVNPRARRLLDKTGEH